MRIQKRDSGKERLILIGMIVDVVVLGRISSKWQNDMFKSRWANIVSKWCVSFYNKYNDVPMNQIESIFESWAAEIEDDDIIKMVEKFLDSLSEEYETLQKESNSDYIVDMAGEYFNRIRVERLAEMIQGDVDRGKVTAAVNNALAFNQIEIGVGSGIDILTNTEALKEALTEQEEALIKYPGALGKFFKKSLARDSFVAFMGPDKVGKSFWLVDVAYRAMLQRRRVAFFEVGDMGQNQVMRRLAARITGRPFYPGTIKKPISIEKDDEFNVDVDWKELTFRKKLSWRDAKKACLRVMEKKIKSKRSYFKLSCHYNSTISVRGIQEIIQNWIREDWVPDVIVIDYADILNMDHPGLDGRDLTNETWKRLRSLSQMFHCLVVTASQTDANAYSSNIITRANFSEDKRKNAHVTGMIGINQNSEEKKLGVIRLNWVVLRENAFNEKRFVYVASCLPIANPAVKSTF